MERSLVSDTSTDGRKTRVPHRIQQVHGHLESQVASLSQQYGHKTKTKNVLTTSTAACVQDEHQLKQNTTWIVTQWIGLQDLANNRLHLLSKVSQARSRESAYIRAGLTGSQSKSLFSNTNVSPDVSGLG